MMFSRFLWRGRYGALMVAVAAVGAVLALTGACGSSAGAVIAHSAAISPANSLIAEVRVTLSREARVFVEYDNPEAGKFRTALSDSGTVHAIPVVRLRPETAYAYTVGVQEADGAVTYGPSGEFTTGRLPPRIDAWRTWVSGRSTQPLIITDYRLADTHYYIFWDETGNIVWYYISDQVIEPNGTGSLHAIRQKPNGNLIYMMYKCCIIEMTALGEVIDRIAASDEAGIPHHDFVMLDDGRILYPSDTHITFDDSANGGDADTTAVVDTLNIWDPQTGIVEQVWDSRDFWDISDPAQRRMWTGRPPRWTHVNSVSAGKHGNFILSARHRYQVISLSPDFQSIEWQLGGPDSDYDFPNPNDRFYAQHSATELPNGNILVFDNGSGRPEAEGGLYSRALELRLDHETRTAVKVWEYRSAANPYSSFVSNAFRLDNGNTLVNFGAISDPTFGPFTFIEATPQGNDVFRVEISQTDVAHHERDRLFRYRADVGLTAIMGETMLRPPVARPVTGEYTYKSRYREIQDTYAALDSLLPVAKERFEVYFNGDSVLYRKEQCAAEDMADKFFLHLFPANPNDLPEERQEHGFDNWDFHFRSLGVVWDDKCLAIANLPGYEIARIRTGQHIPGEDGQIWRAEFAGGR